MSFEMTPISPNVWAIKEEDTRGCNPYCYLVKGEVKVLLVDTGCGCGNLYHFLRQQPFLKDVPIIVVNTHNHPEQTGGNWRFSTAGKYGLARQVEALCASRKHKYYTKLMESNWHWEIPLYKVTKWVKDKERIYLGPRKNAINVVQVFWTPGHTPDSLVLWYPYGNRLFVGDLFYRFDDLMLTYNYTDIREYEQSVRKILKFVKELDTPQSYSASKKDFDHLCLPQFKHFHHFLMSILAGTHPGSPLRIDEAEGSRYETRDRGMRVVLGRRIVHSLNDAREKAQHEIENI